MKSITVKAIIENLDEVNDFINEELEQYDCDMAVEMQIDMAVEEIFVNIANYAYENAVGEAEIRCEVNEDPLSVVIQFLDKGVPFNPLERGEVDLSPETLQERIGGLGIHMVKSYMDDVQYSYENGKLL